MTKEISSLLIKRKDKEIEDVKVACEYCGTRLSKNVPQFTHTVYNFKSKAYQRLQDLIQNCPQTPCVQSPFYKGVQYRPRDSVRQRVHGRTIPMYPSTLTNMDVPL